MSERSKRREAELDDILAALQRLTFSTLDRLEDSTRKNLIGSKEARLLGATALRSLRLWLKALDATPKKQRKPSDREDIAVDKK